jgi:cytochrome P450
MSSIPNFRDTADKDPVGYYDELRQFGDVVWDAEMGVWLIPSYGACKYVLLNEETHFARGAAPGATAEAYEAVQGRRHISLISGKDHQRVHLWWLHAMAPKQTEEWRASVVRPVINEAIDRFINTGKADLSRDFAGRVTINVMAAILGLPWRDDEWMAECQAHLSAIQQFLDTYLFHFDDSITDRAINSQRAMNGLLKPFIDSRRSGTGTDLISMFWRDGPSMLPDWDENDMFVGVRVAFFAGTETTKNAISNALYLLLTNHELLQTIKRSDDKERANFVEEALRMYGSVHFRTRMASIEAELGGQSIHPGDVVVTLNIAANHDPQRYTEPHAVDLKRRVPRDHLAFNLGPRTCPGAGLARVELQESVSIILSRLGGLRLAADGESPTFRGFKHRGYSPLDVVFAPAGPGGDDL